MTENKKDNSLNEIPSPELVAWVMQFATHEQISDMIHIRADHQFILLSVGPKDEYWQISYSPSLEGRPLVQVMIDITRSLKGK